MKSQLSNTNKLRAACGEPLYCNNCVCFAAIRQKWFSNIVFGQSWINTITMGPTGLLNLRFIGIELLVINVSKQKFVRKLQ